MDESMQAAGNVKRPGYFSNLMLQQVRQEPISKAADAVVKQLAEVKTDDVKGIAASQISLLSRFYDLSLDQAGRSFRWALIASIIGLIFFLAAIGFQMMASEGSRLATITLIGGAMIEFIAGINFYLYGKTLSQLTLFQGRLEVTQRFLLANSLCESLGADYKDEARASLIAQLTNNSPSDFRDRAQPRRSAGRRGRNAVTTEEVRVESGNPAAGNQPM